jgi:hypothetical protein
MDEDDNMFGGGGGDEGEEGGDGAGGDGGRKRKDGKGKGAHLRLSGARWAGTAGERRRRLPR